MSDAKSSAEPSMEEILASIRRILAEDDGGARPSLRRPRGDVLDLTEAIGDDGTVRHLEPATSGAETSVTPILFADRRVEPTSPLRPSTDHHLLSGATAEAVATSFQRLTDMPRESRLSERQLDEAVRDVLQPMLQTWLDAHLPALVERLVQAEISRLVGAAEKR